MKKNSTKMKLLSAAGMLAISAAMLATSTYAWFSMNKEVSVTNMQLKAKSEDGILIAAYTQSNSTWTAPTASAFSNTANASAADVNGSTVAELLPTFTSAGTTWYHAASKVSNNGQDYTDAGYTVVTNDTTNSYYLTNKFQIKSTGDEKAVYVKSITVTRGTEENYDPSMRVMIKSGDATLFFAPIGEHTGSETILAATADDDALEANESITFVSVNTTGAKILNDVTTTAEDVQVYIYFDGEDAACKTDNVGDFANKSVSIEFTTDTPTGT
ncbi:hypothetical protein [Ruminococcus sp. NK3A76]|uniref:hypothetical protein n=1 Tax=Ruminococcus sp. NK3A76 TaxID=877411 RepID=UPI00048C9250|nr:hypothetical protein [Ruminococcus sp. NK3A76]